MSLINLMNQIESLAFQVKYTVANSLKILLLFWEEDTIINSIVESLMKDENDILLLLDRIRILSQEEIPVGAMHRQDIVVAIYLYSLHKASSLGAEVLAINIILKTKGFYWAWKLAEQFLTETEEFALTDNQYAIIHSDAEEFVLTDNQYAVIQTSPETNYSVTTIVAA
jgi:hypothetical protein